MHSVKPWNILFLGKLQTCVCFVISKSKKENCSDSAPWVTRGWAHFHLMTLTLSWNQICAHNPEDNSPHLLFLWQTAKWPVASCSLPDSELNNSITQLGIIRWCRKQNSSIKTTSEPQKVCVRWTVWMCTHVHAANANDRMFTVPLPPSCCILRTAYSSIYRSIHPCIFHGSHPECLVGGSVMQKTELLSTSYSPALECSRVKVTLRADDEPCVSALLRKRCSLHSPTLPPHYSFTSQASSALDSGRLIS